MPAMCLRFWPEWKWVKDAIDEGRYGRPLSARFRRVAEARPGARTVFWMARNPVAACLISHIHDADFAAFCFGRPTHIYAQGHTKVSGEIDHVLAQYTVPRGATVSAEGSWAMAKGFGFNMAYTVNFENATVDYDLARGDDALKIFEPDKEPQVLKLKAGDGYTGQITHFVESIQAGSVPSIVTAQDGLTSIELLRSSQALH